MNIRQYRSSFHILILDTDVMRGQNIQTYLGRSGFNVDSHTDFEELFSILKSNPPHILFLEQDTLIIFGENLIDEILALLPEIHIIIYAKQEDIYSTSQFISRGVYDCVAFNEENLA